MKKDRKEYDVSEENVDGLMHILRGIEMMYDIDIDERNCNRDRLEKVRKEDKTCLEAMTYASQGAFVKELSTIYAMAMTMLDTYEELYKEKD